MDAKGALTAELKALRRSIASAQAAPTGPSGAHGAAARQGAA